ncbi:MAG: permease-like cell division protein FtsX, partial [Bacteroidota bacterium]
MATKEEKLSRSRLRSSYLSVVVSITLVLFSLGALGFVLLNGKMLSDYFKENIDISIFLKDNAKDADVVKLHKSLDANPYVKSAERISKEEAAESLQQELGEDFIQFLEYNPLKDNIVVKLNAAYAHPDSISGFIADMRAHPKVHEVNYQKNLLTVILERIKGFTIVSLIFSGLLLIIAIALINNSIRLAVYSKRLLIRSMQLVGATRGFIRRPFVWRGVFNGILGAILANGMLVVCIYYVQRVIPGV